MTEHYKQTHGGKGSARRNANDKAYADNWEAIFGKKEKAKKKPLDWHLLNEYQQQLAIENDSIIYKRYRLSQKYGKHVYNYLTNGGIRQYNDKYVVLWDSSDSNQ